MSDKSHDLKYQPLEATYKGSQLPDKMIDKLFQQVPTGFDNVLQNIKRTYLAVPGVVSGSEATLSSLISLETLVNARKRTWSSG
jgi:hypothetical protein